MATETTTKKKAPAKTAVKKTKPVEVEKTELAAGSYLYALGRRKTSIARVRVIKNGKGNMTVNGKPFDAYFTTWELRDIVKAPLKTSGQETAVDVIAMVQGGGMRGQAESVRLGVSRALTELNPTFRKTLKKLGYLTRDPRAKERKKPGRRKARRSPQWSKR